MKLQAELAQLRSDIRNLKIDFDRFLNGALPTPPDGQRERVIAELRRLNERAGHSYADRYLLSSIEASFNALNELYNRRIREAEQGAERAAAERASRFDPRAGVELGERSRPEAVEALYHALYGANGREAKTDLASFRRFLTDKAAKIRSATGCERVRFRVQETKGTLKLKALPVGEGAKGDGE